MKKQGFILLKRKIEFLFYLFVISIPLMFLSVSIFAGTPNWSKSTVNGNFLTLTPELSWMDAEAWANEWGGHLVTLRSWPEEKWIKETFGSIQYFWIGLNVIGCEHSKENFFWSSGEPVVYSNWCEGEPNNNQGIEDAIVMNFYNDCNGLWNDLPSSHEHVGLAEIVTDDELGLVLESYGEVSIIRSTPQTKQGGDTIRKGDLLKTVDQIKTYTNGLVKAAFPAEHGCRQVEIYSETEVRVAEFATPFQTTLEFFKGKIKSIIEDLPENYSYEVITPQAVLAPRGTEFIVEGDESSMELTVIEGSVEVTNLDSTQSVTVNQNHAVQATAEGIGEPYAVEIEPDYFDEGSGAEHDPWLIEIAGHLNNVRHFLGEEHQDKHFKQTADINLGESPWNEGEGWVPIGTADSSFYGNYNGNDKEISNLYINRNTTEYQGFFGWNNGTISNLGIVDASVTDNGSRAGILAGINDSGRIVNCYTTGAIQSDHEDGRIGGLTGWNSSTIEGSHSTAFVASKGVLTGGLTGVNSGGSVIDSYASGEVHSASIQVGGLAGSNQAGGQITRCYTTGKTTGENYVGGLVGSNRGENSTIDQSYSTGEVVGNDCVGGLVGIQFNSCQISKSHSMGAVHAEGNWAGGLVGMCYDHAIISESFSASDVYAEGYSAGGLCGSIEKNCTIKNAYATGNVSGLEWTGGLAGWADSSQIINSYSNCHVLCEYVINAGGLTGGGSETEIVHSFWNTETSGQIANEGGEGKNTSEMLSQTTFTDWNFDSIWSIGEESSYPYLQWQEEPGTHNFPVFYTMSLQPNSKKYGSIEGGGDYVAGALLFIAAKPNEGYKFINWTHERNIIGKQKTILLLMPDTSINLTANFLKCSDGKRAWKSGGPYFGYVNSIAISPSNPNIIYIGTDNGVYKSSDHGDNWSQAGLSGIRINVLCIHPENPNNLYAGTNLWHGIFKSSNGGNEWIPKAIARSPEDILSLDIDRNNPSAIWAGTLNGKIFKSIDSGETWRAKHHEVDFSSGYSRDVPVNSIKVDPVNSSIIYATLGEGKHSPNNGKHGFIKTIDGGNEWEYSNLDASYGMALVSSITGINSQTLYIIAEGKGGNNDVYMSIDEGKTWDALNVALEPYSLTVNDENSNWLYLGTNDNENPLIAFNSNDGTWHNCSAGLPPMPISKFSIAVCPDNPDYIYIGSNIFYKSIDQAESWDISNKGINNSFIKDIAMNPKNSKNALTAFENSTKLYKTENGGESWNIFAPGLTERFTTITINPIDTTEILVGTDGKNWPGKIYKSIDYGQNWKRIDNSSYSGKVKDIWFHPSNPDIILALKDYRYYSDYHYWGGVRRTTDSGSSWDQVLNSGNPNCVVSDPNNPDNVYLGVENIGYVYKSTDAGLNWTNISPGDVWNNVFDIVVDSESNLYAAVTEYKNNAQGGIWKWDGISWSLLYQLDFSEITALTIDYNSNPETLYAGTSNAGIFRSKDKRESWEPFNNGLKAMNITKLEIGKTEPEFLYAGIKYGGVWSINLKETDLINITAHTHENGSITPTDEVEVEYGNEQVFTIIPDEGFRVAFISVDGTEINLETDKNWDAESGKYTFSNVTEAHTIEVGFEDATAVKDVADQNELKVYPNPAKNELWIEFNYRGSDSPVIVLQNLKGQPLKQIPVNETGSLLKRMSTNNLASGVYLLTIKGKQVFPVQRVMIEN